MRLTLLDYVQTILSSLDSDEVNSISDTTESLQVANVVKQTYFNVIARTDLPEHKQLIQLLPSLTETQPVLMYIPDGIGKIDWLKYFNNSISDAYDGTENHGINVDLVPQPSWVTSSTTSNTISVGSKTFTVASGTLPIAVGQGVTCESSTTQTMSGTVTSYSGTTLVVNITQVAGSGTFSSWTISANSSFNQAVPGYEYVRIIPVQEFLNITNAFNPAENSVESFTFQDNSNGFNGSYTFYYRTDRQPRYCTVLSDYYIIFDSYNSALEGTLQATNTMAYGLVIPSWKMEDKFVPNIDETTIPLFLNEAKSLAFYELKQTLHQKAEQEAKRGWSSVQRDKSKVDRPSYFEELPSFGRWGRGSRAGLSYFKLRGWDRT